MANDIAKHLKQGGRVEVSLIRPGSRRAAAQRSFTISDFDEAGLAELVSLFQSSRQAQAIDGDFYRIEFQPARPSSNVLPRSEVDQGTFRELAPKFFDRLPTEMMIDRDSLRRAPADAKAAAG